MKIITIILFCLLVGACSNTPVVSMGAERTGFAISISDAIEKAKPYFYSSFKLRNPSSKLSEKEYEEAVYFQVFVLVERNYYIIFRDLPKKMRSQHLAHPVKVGMFDGEVVKPN